MWIVNERKIENENVLVYERKIEKALPLSPKMPQ